MQLRTQTSIFALKWPRQVPTATVIAISPRVETTLYSLLFTTLLPGCGSQQPASGVWLAIGHKTYLTSTHVLLTSKFERIEHRAIEEADLERVEQPQVG